jgi:hypothetical protein
LTPFAARTGIGPWSHFAAFVHSRIFGRMHPHWRPKILVFTCAALLGVGSSALAQSNLGEFKDAPSGKFTPEDFTMLWATVDAVSVTRKTGTSKSWENAATGNGGTIKLLNVFSTADGRDCRRLRVDNHAKKLKGSSKQIVCAGPDGKWMVDSDARPGSKKP